jgi:hypothetical protein
MKLPVTAYLVLMHHQEAGTFSPAFPTLDEAEEFSNAMRAITNGLAVAEPIPMVATENHKVTYLREA